MNTLIDNHFCLSIAAPRQSGKSYFVKQLLKNKRFINKFDVIHILCPSLDFNYDYDEFRDVVKPRFEYEANPTQGMVKDLIKSCEESKRQEVDRKRSKSKNPITCPSTLLILDDCIDSGLFSFRGEVDSIAERGPHFKLSCIVMSQRISSISHAAPPSKPGSHVSLMSPGKSSPNSAPPARIC